MIRQVVYVFIPLLVVPMLMVQTVSAQTSANEHFSMYQESQKLYSEARYTEAAEVLDLLVRRSPEDSSLWFLLARALDRTDHNQEAIKAYRTAFDIGYRYDGWIPYRIAQLYGKLTKMNPTLKDSAYVWLETALRAGYGNRPGIANEDAFRGMRGTTRFADITGHPSAGLGRDDGWRFDIDYLVEEARRMHSHPNGTAHSPSFAAAAESLKTSIPELSNNQILAELSRLVTMLGDGHTGIYGPDSNSPLTFGGKNLPVLFYAFADGLYIVDAAPEYRQWVGSRVSAFGPLSVDEVLSLLPTYVHHDNPITPLWLGVHFTLRQLGMLMAFGATDDPSHITLTLNDKYGGEHKVGIKGGNYEFRRKLRAPQSQTEVPRWLRRVDRNYWLDTLPDIDAIYWQFNQVRDIDGGPTIAQFADTLRNVLESADARTLIVDVRHNNGGNNGLVKPLLQTLVWWEQDKTGRRIYVITGRNTFSAAQNFITRVERLTDAIFVGEPSSSSPNFSGEETNLLLPYSRVRGSISNRYWQDSDPDDVRPWIFPAVPVELTSNDYFSGRDTVMEAIQKIIDTEHKQ